MSSERCVQVAKQWLSTVHSRGDMSLLASHGCEVVFAHLERPSAIRKVDSANESADFTSVRK